MLECPFCGADVPTDLVTYGGPCPKCFAEIPGEEAPTDPGAEARALQERKDRRGATIRAFVGLAAMAAVVTCTGVAALAVVLWPEPEVAVLDFDAMEYDYPEFELTGAPEGSDPNDGVADADAAPKPRPGAPRPAAPKGDGGVDKFAQKPAYDGGDGGAAEGLAEDRVAKVDGPRGPRTDPQQAGIDAPTTLDKIEGPKGSGTDDFDLPGVEIRRRSEVLTDPDAIVQMIGKLMRQNIPRLKMCYERELKKDPSLGGRWLIKYTVTKDGKAVNASATGRDTSNAEMEACMAQVIESRWAFDRIVRDQPVQKTLTFRPG